MDRNVTGLLVSERIAGLQDEAARERRAHPEVGRPGPGRRRPVLGLSWRSLRARFRRFQFRRAPSTGRLGAAAVSSRGAAQDRSVCM